MYQTPSDLGKAVNQVCDNNPLRSEEAVKRKGLGYVNPNPKEENQQTNDDSLLLAF